MIRAWTPELAFHDEFKPILSLSVSSSGRFATAGADHNIRLWRLDDDHRDGDGCPRVVFLASVSKHTLPVNVVRFSPDGKLLASASDDCNVMLWTQDDKQAEDSTAIAADAEQPNSAEPLPSTAPALEPVIELDNDVICLTPASPTRSPARPSDISSATSLSSASPSTSPIPPSSSAAAVSPPSSPTAAPFARDAESDFSSLNVEQWSRACLLRGHLSEIYALHWSPDGSQLVTGSIEGRVVVWQLTAGTGAAGKKLQRQELSDHNGYVQGVGWDPRGELVVSASSDRTVRVYRWGRRKGKDGLECRLIHTLKGRRVQQEDKVEERIDDDVVMVDAPSESASGTALQPSTPPHASSSSPITAELMTDMSTSAASPTLSSTSSSSTPLFVDETLPSFFRRPAWSPDGLFVLLPAGCYTDQGKTSYCTWLYHRDDFTEPLACLTHTEPSVAAVFSPHPYRPSSIADAGSTPSSSPLPFAYLFIIATTKSLLLYCTHSCHALASLTNLHLSALTDLAWATQSPTPPHHADSAQQAEPAHVEEDTRRKWATEDRVLVSSSDGYISIVDMQGLAEKLHGEQRRQWEEQVAQDVCRARKRIDDGVDSEVRQKKRKRKKVAADSAASSEPSTQSAEGRTELSTALDGVEASVEAKQVKSVIVFELTDEVKAQLQQMVDGGVPVTVDSVREHCKVSLSRATRMARKWKELQKQQRKQQAEAAAKAAAERWDKMDREHKLQQQQATEHTDAGKEEKAEGGEGRAGEEAGGEGSERRRKERVKAPIVPVEDAKRMKKIDSFFTKSATPQYAVATPPTASSSSFSSSSSSSATSPGSSLPLAPLPLLAEEAPMPGAKRKIVPLLISTLTPIDHNSHNATTMSPAVNAQNPATASTTKPTKGAKKKPKSRKRQPSKKTVAAAAPMAAIAVSQLPTTAPALFAVTLPAAPAPSTTAALSIDLTDEPSVSPPPAPNLPAALPPAAGSDAAAAAVAPAAASAVVSSGAVVVRQGSGSRRITAGPPSSVDDQPPAKKPRRTIVPTVVSDAEDCSKQQNSAEEASSDVSSAVGVPVAIDGT